MNKIKFRVWDVNGKKMFPFEEVCCTGVDISTPDGRNYQSPLFAVAFLDNKQKLLAQQFTGVQDIHQKDAYEGDIIKINISIDPLVKKEINGVIVWDERDLKWAVKCKEFGAFPRGLRHYKFEFEIIGNIYENPELIT